MQRNDETRFQVLTGLAESADLSNPDGRILTAIAVAKARKERTSKHGWIISTMQYVEDDEMGAALQDQIEHDLPRTCDAADATALATGGSQIASRTASAGPGRRGRSRSPPSRYIAVAATARARQAKAPGRRRQAVRRPRGTQHLLPAGSRRTWRHHVVPCQT